MSRDPARDPDRSLEAIADTLEALEVRVSELDDNITVIGQALGQIGGHLQRIADAQERAHPNRSGWGPL